MYSYYIDRGFTLEYLENLPFFKAQFFISSMYVNREEHIQEEVEKIKHM
ncbi:hypothetical protein [uncultured Clostridium sp.]|nr:hypothetical protein [uncultured Clostridium sp.]